MTTSVEHVVTERSVGTLAAQACDWLLGDTMPLWSGTGRTPSGLFAERLASGGIPDDAYFRVFVQARHIYSTVMAGQLGWQGPWQDLAGETIHTLLTRARRADGFFVHRLDRNAGVIDGRADLYDQAFVLFALGTAGAALGDEALFDAAEALLDTIEVSWAHPCRGFREGEIVDPSIRRQNPHMHLLEAFSVLHDASGRRRFADAARNIVQLFQCRFMDPGSGALLEYFTQDWTPARGQSGRIAEPGHCFEWAWLLERGADQWEGAVAASDRLTRFGRCYGIDAGRNVVVNEVLTDGAIASGQARLWPQTERIKMAVARFRRTGSNEDLQDVMHGWLGLQKYFLPGQPGLWCDRMHEDGSFTAEPSPGSSLYHIVGAIREICSLPQHFPPDIYKAHRSPAL